MTLSDYRKSRTAIVNLTLLFLGDPLGEKHAPARVAEIVNDVVMDFVLKTQMIKEEINVQLLADVQEYDIANRVEVDGTLRLYGYPIRVGFNGSDCPALPSTELLILDLFGYSQAESVSPNRWHVDTVSPGKIVIFGPPATAGEALPSEENNIQVTYVAMPGYMDDATDYPDIDIPATFHQAFAYGAAAILAEESDDPEIFMKSVEFDDAYAEWVRTAVAESYRNMTKYDDFRPM